MRLLTDEERPLVQYLADLAGLALDLDTLRAQPLSDGGMGSLRFDSATEAARFGRSVAEATFEDEDGVPVTAALYMDEGGALFELDVWKVDFSPLRRWPTVHELDRRTAT